MELRPGDLAASPRCTSETSPCVSCSSWERCPRASEPRRGRPASPPGATSEPRREFAVVVAWDVESETVRDESREVMADLGVLH